MSGILVGGTKAGFEDFYLSVFKRVHVHTHEYNVHKDQKRLLDSPWAGITDGCGLSGLNTHNKNVKNKQTKKEMPDNF